MESSSGICQSGWAKENLDDGVRSNVGVAVEPRRRSPLNQF